MGAGCCKYHESSQLSDVLPNVESHIVLSTSQVYPGLNDYLRTYQRKYNSVMNVELRNEGFSRLNRFLYDTERYVSSIDSVTSDSMIETLVRLIDSFLAAASETLTSLAQYVLTLSFLMLAVNYQIALCIYLRSNPNQASEELERLNTQLNLKNKQVFWLKNTRRLFNCILQKYHGVKTSSSWLLLILTKLELLILSLPDVDELKKAFQAIVKIVGGVLKTTLTLTLDWNIIDGLKDATKMGLSTIQRNMAWTVAGPLLECDQIFADLNYKIRNNKLTYDFRTTLYKQVAHLCSKIFPNGSTGVRWELCGGFAIMLCNIIRCLSGEAYLNILLTSSSSSSSYITNIIATAQSNLSEVVDTVLQLPDNLSKEDYEMSPVVIYHGINTPTTLTLEQVTTLKEMHTTCLWLWNGDNDFLFPLSKLMQYGLSKGVSDSTNNIKDTLSDLVYWFELLQNALTKCPENFSFRQWLIEGFNIVFDELQVMMSLTFPTLITNLLEDMQSKVLDNVRNLMSPNSKIDNCLAKKKEKIGEILELESRIITVQSVLTNEAVNSLSKGNKAIKILTKIIDKILNLCPTKLIQELNVHLIQISFTKLHTFLSNCGVNIPALSNATDLGTMVVMAFNTVCREIINNNSRIFKNINTQPEVLDTANSIIINNSSINDIVDIQLEVLDTANSGIINNSSINDIVDIQLEVLVTANSGIINNSSINDIVNIQLEELVEDNLLKAVENISGTVISELEELQRVFVGKQKSQIVGRKTGDIQKFTCKTFESLEEEISKLDLFLKQLKELNRKKIFFKGINKSVSKEEKNLIATFNEHLKLIEDLASNFEVNGISIITTNTDNIDKLNLLWIKFNHIVNVVIDKLEPLRKLYDLALNIHQLLPLLELNVITVNGNQLTIHAVCSLLLNLSNKINYCYDCLILITDKLSEVFTMSGLSIPSELDLLMSKLYDLSNQNDKRSIPKTQVDKSVQNIVNLIINAKESVGQYTRVVKEEITDHLITLKDLIKNSNDTRSMTHSKLIIYKNIIKANNTFKSKITSIKVTYLNDLKRESDYVDNIIKSCFDEINGLLEEIKEGSIKGFLETFKQPLSFIEFIKNDSMSSTNESINEFKNLNIPLIMFTLREYLNEKLSSLTYQSLLEVNDNINCNCEETKVIALQLHILKTLTEKMSSMADQPEKDCKSICKGLDSMKSPIKKIRLALENSVKFKSTASMISPSASPSSKISKVTNISNHSFVRFSSITSNGDSVYEDIRSILEKLQKKTNTLHKQAYDVFRDLGNLSEIIKCRDLYRNIELPDNLEALLKIIGYVDNSNLNKQVKAMSEDLKDQATHLFIETGNELEVEKYEKPYQGGIELVNSMCSIFSSIYNYKLVRKQQYRVREIAVMCALQLIAPTSSAVVAVSPLTPPPCNKILKEIIFKCILEWKVFESQKIVHKILREDENSVTQILTLNMLFHTTKVYGDLEEFESDTSRGITSRLEGMQLISTKQFDYLNARLDSIMSLMIASNKEKEREILIDHQEILREIITSRFASLDEMRELAENENNDPFKKQQILYDCKLEIKALSEATTNLKDISQKLNVVINFLSEMRSKLDSLDGKLDFIQKDIKSLRHDMKRLVGRPVLEIILETNDRYLDKITGKFQMKVYVECSVWLPGPEKDFKKSNKKKGRPLLEAFEFFLEDKDTLNNFVSSPSKINRVVPSRPRNILLLSGKAGSGKSTAVEKIITYILKRYSKDRSYMGKSIVLIYVSLPTLKDPIGGIFEEGVKMYYGLTPSQTQELKEAIQKPDSNIEVIFLLDAYDELRHDALGKNLWRTNNLEQYRPVNCTSNNLPKVIISCRSEFLSSENGRSYRDFFLPEENSNSDKKASNYFMELEFIPFGDLREEYQSQHVALTWRDAFRNKFGKTNEAYNNLRQLPNNFDRELSRIGAPESTHSLLSNLCTTLFVKSEQNISNVDILSITDEIQKNQEFLKQILVFDEDGKETDQLELSSWILSLLAYVFDVQSKDSILDFWKTLVKHDQQLWLPDDYNDAFNSMPELKELTTTPFMVEIITKILPTLKHQVKFTIEMKNNLSMMVGETIADIAWSIVNTNISTNNDGLLQIKDNESEAIIKEMANKIFNKYLDSCKDNIIELPNDIPASCIAKHSNIDGFECYLQHTLSQIFKQKLSRRHSIYTSFIKLYIGQGLEKALVNRSAVLQNMDFKSIVFAKKLAIYLTKNGNLKLNRSQQSNFEQQLKYEEWFSFNSSEQVETIRNALPLHISDDSLHFFHKTIQEYFVALDIVDTITEAVQNCSFKIKDLNCDNFLKNLEENSKWKVAVTNLCNILCTSSLNEINLESEVGIIDFIVDFIMSDPKLVDGLKFIYKFITACYDNDASLFFTNNDINGISSVTTTFKLRSLSLVLKNIFAVVTKSLPRSHKQTLLHLASGEGAENIVEFTIDILKVYKDKIKIPGISMAEEGIVLLLDSKDEHGATSLMYACGSGHMEVVKVLLHENVDREAKDRYEKTALIYACNGGHIEVVKLLLEKEATKEAKDGFGKTVLIYASEGGHGEVVRFLLGAKIGTEVNDENGKTALMYACEKGHIEVVKLLLDDNVELECYDKYRKTALIYASVEGHYDVVKILLDKGADKEAKDNKGKTALMYASLSGLIDIVTLLVNARAEKEAKDEEGKTALIYSSIVCNIEVVKSLLKDGADKEAKDNKGKSALMHASEIGHMEVVKLLLDAKLKIEAKDEEGKTALIYASIEGHYDVVKILLDKGADKEAKDNKGKTALMYASLSGLIDIVTLLVNATAEKEAKDEEGKTALIYSSIVCNIEVVKSLLKDGADKEAKDNKGKSALMHASEIGHMEVVKLLLQNGADKEAKDASGSTALLYAWNSNHNKVVELLLEQKVDKEVIGNIPKTTLVRAVTDGDIEVIRILLDEGSDMEAMDASGKTVLMLACESGRYEVVKLLLDTNVETDAKDEEGKTALMYASIEGHIKIVKLLLETGIEMEAKDKFGRSALVYASKVGKAKIAQVLVSCGADTKVIDFDKRTALMYASQSCHIEVVNLLIISETEKEAKDSSGKTAFMLACESGHIEIVKLLLRERVDKEANGASRITALMLACENGHVEVVKLLLSAKVKIEAEDEEGKTALIYASMKGHNKVVKVLLTNGVDEKAKDKFGRSALIHASIGSHTEVVKSLLGDGADKEVKDVEKWTALMYGSQSGNAEVVKLLLKGGINKEAKDSYGKTALMLACESGHTKVVKLLIKSIVEIEAKDEEGKTALMHASHLGHFEVVQLLLKKGTVKTAKDNYGKTALMLACESGHYEVVKLLLEVSVGTDTKDEEGKTALMYASIEGHIKVVELLVNRGAKKEATDKLGRSAIIYASKEGNTEVVKLLSMMQANMEIQDHFGGTALIYASKGGHVEVVKFLLDKEVEITTINQEGITALNYAIIRDRIEVVKLFLTKGTVIETNDDDGQTALIHASMWGHINIVKLLLKEEADKEAKNSFGSTALMLACDSGHVEVVKLLLDADVDKEAIDEEGKTALMYASIGGHIKVVELLANRGADKEATDEYGRSAIIYACDACNVEVVKLLLAGGAKKEIQDNFGGTALIYASNGGHVEVVKLLLETSTELEAKDGDGMTALIFASIRGNIEVVKILLEAGANKETKCDMGQTALIYASQGGHIEVVKILLEAGADKETTSYIGQTALIYASMWGHSEVVKLLLENGADKEAMNISGETALIFACNWGHIEVVKLLLAAGVNKEAKGNIGQTALIYASIRGNIEVVEVLLSNETNKEVKDENGQTALVYASMWGHGEVVKLLLENGADKEAMNMSGETSLIFASIRGHIDVLKLLLDKGANKEAKSDLGKTALIYASQKGRTEVVKLLLHERVNKEAMDVYRKTSLIYASEEGHYDVVELLLEEEVDMEAKDNIGKTALIYASQRGRVEVLKLLLKKGADKGARDIYGKSVLIYAGHNEVVKILLNEQVE